MNVTLLTISLSTVAAFNLFLGLWVFLRNESTRVNTAFLLMALAISGWSLTILMSWLPLGETALDFWSNATFIGPTVFIAVFLYFSYVFPNTDKKLQRNKIVILGIPAAAVVILALSQQINIQTYNPWTIDRGFGIHVFNIYFVFYIALSFWNLYHSLKISNEVQRKQVSFVLYGLALGIGVGSFFNLALPLIFQNARLTFVGPAAGGTIFVVFIAYAIFKHNLFNIRVIATEIFTSVVVLVFLINVFLSNSTGDLIFNVFLFILVTIFGILLIRGTIREIRTLEALSEQKSQFISIASHQLRTPLTALKGYLSMMREGSFGKLSERQLDVVNKSYRANEGMARLVEDFLNLSRAEKGTLTFVFREENLAQLVDDLVDGFEDRAEEAGLELKWQKPPEPVKVSIDKNKLQQVIANLIDNAIKYTQKGGVSVRISTQDAPVGMARVYVKDTGIGLDPVEKDSIFESFSRGKEGAKTNASGAGLGLYVAKMMVEGHNGKIWAESPGKGEGTTFVIEIPLASSPKAPKGSSTRSDIQTNSRNQK